MTNHNFNSIRALIDEEATNNDRFYRDSSRIGTIREEIVKGRKDSVSIELARWIRQKKYGIDVREALARFVEWISVQTTKIFDESERMFESNDKLQEDIDAFTKDFENRYNSQIAGNTDLNEVIDARSNVEGEVKATLKERIDEVEKASLTSLGKTDFEEVYGGIREIFKPQISEMRRKLMPHKDKVIIAQITDTHYTTRDFYWGKNQESTMSVTHIFNIGALSQYLDFAIATGDNADPNIKQISQAKKYNRDFATIFHTAIDCPTALLKGNHDDNSAYTEGKPGVGLNYVLSDEDFANIYLQDGSNGEIRDGNSNYFYIDIKGVRVIGLDSFDTLEVEDENGNIKHSRLANSAFSSKQVNWFYNEALQTDLPVIIFTHCQLKGTWAGGHGISANHDAISTLIEAFKNGRSGVISTTIEGYEVNLEYSFDKKHDVIACVYGHRHTDYMDSKHGINHITSQNSFGSNGSYYDKNFRSYQGTAQEDSWSVFVIDTKTKQVEWLKFGRGTDKRFSY